MKELLQEHLTDNQFTECFFGSPDLTTAAHLSSCESCRKQLANFYDTMADFGRVSMAWSESASPAYLRTALTERKRVLPIGMQWRVMSTAVAVLIIALIAGHPHRAQHDVAVAPVAVDVDDAAQIAADNKLMENVYVALNPDDATMVRELQIIAPAQIPTKTLQN